VEAREGQAVRDDNDHETPWTRVARLEQERLAASAESPCPQSVLEAWLATLDEDDEPRPLLTLVPDPTDEPTTAELVEALGAAGSLAEQKAVQRLLRRQRLKDSVLRLEEQARDRQRAASAGLRVVRDDGDSQDAA
jgi:hypothetical protein